MSARARYPPLACSIRFRTASWSTRDAARRPAIRRSERPSWWTSSSSDARRPHVREVPYDIGNRSRRERVRSRRPVIGTHIKYVEEGQGAPIVFVHGGVSDHRAWEAQREIVARHYRFIAIDQRYFG